MRLATAEAPKFGHVLLEDMVAQIDLDNAKRIIARLEVSPSLDGRLDNHTGELLKEALQTRFGLPVAPSRSRPASSPASTVKQRSPFLFLSKFVLGPRRQDGSGASDQAQRMGLGGKAWVFAEAILRTILATLVRPLFWSLCIALAVSLPLQFAFNGTQIEFAIASRSFAPIFAGEGLRWVAIAAACGVAVMATRGLSTFLFSSRTYLSRNLGKHLPSDETLLHLIPIPTLQFYHNVLRCAGAVAFLSEFVLEMLAIALITWGIVLGVPALHLFSDKAVSLVDVQLFWLSQIFTMIDGPNTFGVTLSSLEANKSVWQFGIVILSFRFIVVGLIVRLFLDSINLQPRDISAAWGAAFERQKSGS
ncbi:MAG: hypothetical protein ABL883_02410 [Terricaulis sp.]